MIEVSAKLIGGPVYLPGDNIGCCISFTNKKSQDEPNSSSKSERLAWSSAQIHCLCVTNDKIVLPISEESMAPEELSVGSHETSFVPYKGDQPGRIVFSTTPKILFCDLRLQPEETRSYLYTETLQNEIPPSYKGQLVKYSYKITIGTQRVNSSIKLLRIPLRILVINGFLESSACEDSIDLSPSNPFLESNEKERDHEPTLQVLQNITTRRNTNFYNITNTKGKVARFCLFKQAYKLGEDIVGTFDFTNSTVRCIQFAVSLQCEEIISKKYRVNDKKDRTISSFSSCHEMCVNLRQCFLNIPIPLYVSPSFTTDIMSLKWKLHFEFVTSIQMDIRTGDNRCSNENKVEYAPKSLDIETMVWDLPIQIYPSCTSDLNTQIKSCIVI